jgi:hypothetical protein
MQTFDNASSGAIVLSMAERIVENRAYLSEIDGKIGDGDHGVNMAKGFGMAAERLKGKDAPLAESLDTLGTVLMTEIGGSMGPLYGVMFTEFAEAIEGVKKIDAAAYSKMLHAGLAGIQSIGSAKVGDKTLRPSRRSTKPLLTANHSATRWKPWLPPPKPAATRRSIWWQKSAGPAVSASARSAYWMPAQPPAPSFSRSCPTAPARG